jgi:hypothetical protein
MVVESYKETSEVEQTINEGDGTIPWSPYGEDGSVFKKINIYGVGFPTETCDRLRKLISDNGGVFFNADKPPLNFIHYIVAPHARKIKPNPGSDAPDVPVTSFEWIIRCIEEGKIMDPSSCPLFTPLPKLPPYLYYFLQNAYWMRYASFKGKVVCISGFVGEERSNIVHLITLLGATYTDKFLRKTCTHLICKGKQTIDEIYRIYCRLNLKFNGFVVVPSSCIKLLTL